MNYGDNKLNYVERNQLSWATLNGGIKLNYFETVLKGVAYVDLAKPNWKLRTLIFESKINCLH